ncbi:MAG: sulfotransferase [Candidatus Thiodiazotropha sp.]
MDIDRQKNDKTMVFVTGASRSGTTMLSRMLGNHSMIACFKELHCFGDLVDPNKLQESIAKSEAIHLGQQIIARSKRDIWGSMDKEDCEEAKTIYRELDDADLEVGQVLEQIMTHLAVVQDKHIPCEQTPRNIFYARQLLKYYPHLHIVHIVRDPRDVLASQKKRWKRKILGGDNIPYTEIIRVWFNYHPYTMTTLWSKATRFACELEAHERFHLLKFEDILSDPEVEIRKLCKILNISFEASMINIPHVGSSHEINSDAPNGVSKSSLNRWKSYLNKGEIYICEWLADHEMQAFAYTKSENAKPLSLSLIKQMLIYPIHIFGVLMSNPRRAWIQLQAVIGKSK